MLWAGGIGVDEKLVTEIVKVNLKFIMMRANWSGTMSLSREYWCAMQRMGNGICMIF